MDKYDIFIIIIISIVVIIFISLIGLTVIQRIALSRQSVKTVDGGWTPNWLVNEQKHIIIDGLNLLYHHFKPNNPLVNNKPIVPINTMMKSVVPKLVEKFDGRIMFVFKNKENTPFESINDYKKLANKWQIYIYLCQDYPSSVYKSHSSMGRDDFYSAVLARYHKCRILTYDKFNDFSSFVQDVDPFSVYIINPDIREPHRLINVDASLYRDELYKPRTFTLETMDML